jgi:IMP cyclohydrolase
MYIGRFVIVGRTPQGQRFLAYRVSSRSFPNRRIVLSADRATVQPTADAPSTDNPYITYNCLRQHADTVVVANGSHADPIIEKVAAGYPLRDALALTLLALDYEHDSLSTPRIAAAWGGDVAWLAIVTAHGLLVSSMQPEPGTAALVATYELTSPTPVLLRAEDPGALARETYYLAYEHPVAALASVLKGSPMSATCGPSLD